MTEDSERELTPEEDARIRSLLASARASDRVPDDVASRLDSVLADLASGRAADDDRATPPRWRKGRMFLAAAASVAVVGLAAVNLPQLSGSNNDAMSSKSTSADDGSAGSASDGSGKRAEAGGDTKIVARLHTDSFRGDVRRLLAGDGRNRLAPSASPSSPAAPEQSQSDLTTTSCVASPEPGVVRSRQVLLDGKPALLEVFAVRDGARVVRAVSCDGTATLATTRIPAD